jgi:hypothetical protein
MSAMPPEPGYGEPQPMGPVTIGIVGGAVLCLVIAALAGWYDHRVWTFRARRLWIIV